MICSSNTICTREPAAWCRPWALAAAAALLMALAIAAPGARAVASANSLIAEAEELILQGDTISAQIRLQAAQTKGASRQDIAAAMGRLLLAERKFARARKWLGPAQFSPAKRLQGFRALAMLELESGKMNAAKNAYNRALAIAPENASLWAEIARFRYMGGEHKLALEAADHALALGPHDPDALRLQAELVRDRFGMIPALEWFETAVEISPGDVGLLGEYAATLGEAGQAVRAIEVTRFILELDPANARAYYIQAVIAARAGNFGLARKLLERTGDESEDVPGAMLLRGVVEIAAQNYTLAIEALDPLVKQQPTNARARDLLARALFLSGDYKLLIGRFAGVASGGHASAYLRVLVARAYEQLDRRDLAAALLDRVALGPRQRVTPDGLNDPVGAMLAAGNISGARSLTAYWLAVNPGRYDNLTLAGDVELASGNPSAALGFYRRAADIRMPESLFIRRFQALLMAGEKERATSLAEVSLSYNPASAQARRAVAWLSANAGQWDRARRLYRNLRQTGHARDLQLLCDLSQVQMRAGDAQGAAASADLAYRLFRGHAWATHTNALAQAASGKEPAKAKALLAKARRLLGDNPALQKSRWKLAQAHR